MDNQSALKEIIDSVIDPANLKIDSLLLNQEKLKQTLESINSDLDEIQKQNYQDKDLKIQNYLDKIDNQKKRLNRINDKMETIQKKVDKIEGRYNNVSSKLQLKILKSEKIEN